MATISKEGESIYGRPTRCTFCGEAQSTAVWMGMTARVEVCECCAHEILPALAADAIRRPTLQQSGKFLERLTARFWRAMAMRLLQDENGGYESHRGLV